MCTTSDIQNIISVLSDWHRSSGHTPNDYWLKKRFVVINVFGSMKLAYRADVKGVGDDELVLEPGSVDLTILKIVLGAEDIYDALLNAHESCCHAKRRITWEKARTE